MPNLYLFVPPSNFCFSKSTRAIVPRVSPLTIMSHRVRLLSWNIDMDTAPILARTRALVQQIRHLNPDIVFLQEVTAESLPILTAALRHKKSDTISTATQSPQEKTDANISHTSNPSYLFHIGDTWADKLPYFPIMLTRFGFLTHLDITCKQFPASRMYRNFILAKGQLNANGPRVAFLTSHLESLKEGAIQRKHQIQQLFSHMRELVVDGYATVFAGDTNLREPEVSAKDVFKTLAAEKQRVDNGGLDRPKKRQRVVKNAKFVDAWLAAGASDAEKFTWDMSKNDNLQFDTMFKPKARYDRSFLLWPPEMNVNVERFRLVGKERLALGKFVSDHWGMCIDLIFTGKLPPGEE